MLEDLRLSSRQGSYPQVELPPPSCLCASPSHSDEDTVLASPQSLPLTLLLWASNLFSGFPLPQVLRHPALHLSWAHGLKTYFKSQLEVMTL